MRTFSERIASLTPEKRAQLEQHFLKKSNAPSIEKNGICRRGVADPCALSFAQERLWFLDQLEPGSSAYNISGALRLTGHLKVAALEWSLNEIIRRHEALRTIFVSGNGQPVQMIAPPQAFPLPLIDLSALPEARRESKANQLAREEASRPFDLAAGPLIRATVLQLAPEKHVLLVTMHHIISDGWSMGIFNRELSTMYEAFSKGNFSPLPELPIQYADFALWQKKWLRGEVLESQLMFWKEQLKDITTLELPTDHPRPAAQTFNGARHTFELSGVTTKGLKDLSRKEGVTLFMTLLAAFQCLLHRYTGQKDIVVGSPIANRNHAEVEGLIGFFVNTLLMRTDTSGNPTFRELLGRVQLTALGAYAHQDLPFEKLVEELRPERDLSRNPLFQVMFALQNVPVSNLQFTGLTVDRMELQVSRTRFDLEVHLREDSEGLGGVFIYNTDLFDNTTIERMLEHYQRILEGIVSDPGRRVSELPLLTDAERHQILVQWNDTATEYPRDKCIHGLFEEQVEKTPDAIAVVFEERQLTYRELNSRANRLAHYLRKQGVGPEVPVGICVERSLEMIVGILGILKAGGAYVPIDPTYPLERMTFVMEDTKAPVILTQRHLANVFSKHAASVLCLDADFGIMTHESEENCVNETAADNLAYVMYTSGSTGRPKGVCVLHRGVVRLVTGTNYVRLSSEEVFLQLASISFDASTFEIWGSLLNGAKLVVMPPGTPSIEELGQAFKKDQITTLWLTAGLFHLMVDENLEAFTNVRQLLAGGDVLSVSHVRQLLSNHDCILINGYGPTENTTFTCSHAVELPDPLEKSIPIGRPVANTRVYILDRWLQPVPVGVPGELCIGGDGLARGYLNRPELTAEKFIPNPFSGEPGDRLYRTGDVARYLPDGTIEFMGRIDNQVKVRGFRVEPGEIESVLGRHPAVKETAVMAGKDKTGRSRLVAYVVPKIAWEITINALRNFLKQKLPGYMVPSAFVMLDSLPLTPNGKVDRQALPDLHSGRLDTEKEFAPPRNVTEMMLAQIWEQVLDVRPIGIRDNFFELGGHSLLAVRVASEINKMTKIKFPVMTIFEFPTIEQLTEALMKRGFSVQFSSLLQIQPGKGRLPFFWVHGQQSDGLLSRYLDTSQPLYALIHQGLDGRIHHASLDDICDHYLKEMRTVQPEGPYLLGGYCFGGMIALEMARKLSNEGDEVILLFLLEPPKNCFSPATSRGAPPLISYSLSSRLAYHSENLGRLPFGKKIAYMFRIVSNAFSFFMSPIAKRAKKRIKLFVGHVYGHLGRPLPVSLRTLYLMNLYRSAIRKYTPRLYHGKIILCHSDQMSYGDGVRQMVTGGAEVHRIIGADHQSILNEPYVSIWAEHLNLHLRELQAGKEDKKI
jgi:amino acid adenylation domain-containing protein